MKKSSDGVPMAEAIVPYLCECGCGRVYVTLMDGKDKPFAMFSLNENDWIPFAEDVVRIYRGEPTIGQRHHETTH